jgi:LDH2 family malate/lactate/ureidoglycolate dehydrogenase
MKPSEKTRLTISDATALAVDILVVNGMSHDYARVVANHLIDAALAGHPFAGLPRVLAIVGQLKGRPPAKPIRITSESEVSAQFDGGGNIGYVVSVLAIDKAVEIARGSGVGVVGVNNTWYSGRLAYYIERAATQGFVALHTASSQARVAPHGGIDAILGTNPFSIAFPCDPEPIVIDIGTSMATEGEVLRRKAIGAELPVGWAVASDGSPTTDPAAGFDGALLPWGGPRGYGISLAVQLLGILVGGAAVVHTPQDSGQFFIVIDPTRFTRLPEFKEKAAELVRSLRASRPAEGHGSVRIPGARSQQTRKIERKRGEIDVDTVVYQQLIALRTA